MEKTNDIENYEPISTKVKEARQTPFNDSLTCHLALKMGFWIDEANKALEDASVGDTSRYPKDVLGIAVIQINELIDSINYRIEKLDANKVIGYEVHLYAQGKLKGGIESEAYLRFVTDSEISKILIFDETTSPHYTKYKNIIQAVIDHQLKKFPLDPEWEAFERIVLRGTY